MNDEDENEVSFPIFDEGDKILVQKDIIIKDLEAKNKALDERNTALIDKNNELSEALRQASFKTGNEIEAQPIHMEYKFDIEYKNITIKDFRLQLGEIALQDNGPFDIFMKKVENEASKI